MCCKSFWKRFVPFALTLSLSLFIAEYYNTSTNQVPKIEQNNKQVIQTIVTSESEANNIVRNKCIEFSGNNLYRKKLIHDIEEIENFLKKNDDASRKKAKLYLEKLKKTKDRHAEIGNKKARLSALKESNGIHKLLYIENCLQYSE